MRRAPGRLNAISAELRHTRRSCPPSEPADPLADFLFERRKGHCEYFASAMAVMLRTLGIPSRLVTGFQGGAYNPVSGWSVVRASDAHSWVEAWIDGRGWITFDPTPAGADSPESLHLARSPRSMRTPRTCSGRTG